MANRPPINEETSIMQKLKVKEIVNILNTFDITIQVYQKDREYWVNKYYMFLMKQDD